ncbi:coiled-coil domain-containing protein 81 isoform X2 [Notothenia coriiceps]|uniref:Coiled-coil domain-containing protein 81 isoform X2 n=1 Tax=Notothenia coriiceps TaxID=8208 RepID=A0A6I9P7G1_9TELE|nr:PREDICTED: coiled-coil domain-containing protein 81 isoform X2 [Notothenia coriiceps]
MTDILRLVSEMDGRTLSTLSQHSEKDINCIWGDVSAYIERHMALQKGVHLAGLGTFTFSQQKLEIGNKFTMIQRPIFLLAGKLVQSLGLKQTRPLAAATHLPVVQLNFAAVSQETPFSRDMVEGCVRETLLLLFRLLASEKNIFLTFQGIGVLSFRNNKRPGSIVSLLSGGLSTLQMPPSANPVTMPTVCSPEPEKRAADKAQDQRNAGEVPQQGESKSHQPLQPAKMKAVSLPEELNPQPPMEATDKPTVSVTPRDVAHKLEDPGVTGNCFGHARAGQELCYLCMQRAQINVPVYLREQQQAEEKDQEKLLLLKEQQRDRQHMHQEQEKLNEQREQAKQVATFNLQMSEKKEKNVCPLFPTSFVFPTRPFTPAPRIQQHHYMNELQGQIKSRQQQEARDQRNRVLLEPLDQVQLVQEMASQKAQQLQRKHERTTIFKRALDTQVRDRKSTDPPECQADNSEFNRCETATSNAEGRERAQKHFRINFSTATQRKKEELHNREEQLQKERDVLKHNKMELILDYINRFEKRRDISKSLGDEWSRNAKLKHQREEEDRRFLRSAGRLLVDKLAEYKCCCQCKRRTTNCGETNIWKDSHYLSGSQFMI